MTRHEFGGSWTEAKLKRVQQYLEAYGIALKAQPFERIYVDAFAGTGYRHSKSDGDQFALRFLEIDELAKGSARIALEIEPAFSRYIFIEKDSEKVAALRRLSDEFPTRAGRIEILHEDANVALQEICRSTNWKRNRAVTFLDPYGMQVAWDTIVAIAATRAIDMWYLFPAGIGVGRMFPHQGEIPEKWQESLDRCLGDRDWRDAFYTKTESSDLFGNVWATQNRDFDIPKVEAYFKARLDRIFAGVARSALPLRNGKGNCMYLLFFACGNKNAVGPALRIANHILKR